MFPNNYSNEVPTITEVHYVMRAPMLREEVERALTGPVEGMPFMGILTSLLSG
jgi:hypothetical protein